MRKIDLSKLRFVSENCVHKLYAKDVDENTARYYQVDKDGEVVYSFLGKRDVNNMKGLVENNIKATPHWIKSCKKFRSGGNPYKQPKYFHTDDSVYIKEWYKAAYPDDTWGAEQIEPDLKFEDVRLKWEDETLCIKTKSGRYLNFNDSVVYNRIRKEIDVNEGFSFGYIIED